MFMLFRKRKRFSTDWLLYVALSLNVFIWSFTKDYQPDMAIVPDVPSDLSVKAFALGDEQFYFRSLAFRLQNAGDTFGRFTALKAYNYQKLYAWFTLLDSLDARSNFVPSLAGYYFSQTQHTPDVAYVVRYLEEHARKDMYAKWWWMGQAVYLANNKLQDKAWALDLAYQLAATPRDDIPLWTKQMPAFIYEQLGEEQQALAIIKGILDHVEHIDPGELNFMRYFVQERLKKVIADNPDWDRLSRKDPVFERDKVQP